MSLIYHYCDVNAFMSIIEKDLLWLSSLYSMNDTAEVEYVRRKVSPAIVKVIEDNGADPALLDTFKRNIDSLNYYAACFSSEPDDLYQWQAYGQKGRGFSIGFEEDFLCQYKPLSGVNFANGIGMVTAPVRTAAPGQSVGVSKVEYMSAEQIDDFAQKMARHLQYGFDTSREHIYSVLFDVTLCITVLCSVVKNEKFKAENERRLLYAADISYDANGGNVMGDLKERKWRNGAHGITPYFEYKNIKHAIRRVVMGPNCVELTGSHINDFLRSNGLPAEILSKSEATLR